jgi:hypothetical protein
LRSQTVLRTTTRVQPLLTVAIRKHSSTHTVLRLWCSLVQNNNAGATLIDGCNTQTLEHTHSVGAVVLTCVLVSGDGWCGFAPTSILSASDPLFRTIGKRFLVRPNASTLSLSLSSHIMYCLFCDNHWFLLRRTASTNRSALSSHIMYCLFCDNHWFLVHCTASTNRSALSSHIMYCLFCDNHWFLVHCYGQLRVRSLSFFLVIFYSLRVLWSAAIVPPHYHKIFWPVICCSLR